MSEKTKGDLLKNLMHWRWVCVWTALLTLLIKLILPENSLLVETVFSKGLFVFIRLINDFTVGLLPFPVIYLVLLIYVVIIFYPLSYDFSTRKKIKEITFNTFAMLGFSIVIFYWTWAFNYNRQRIEQKFGLAPVTIDSVYIKTEFNRTYAALIELRNKIHGDTSAIPAAFFDQVNDKHIRNALDTFFGEHDLSFPGRTRVRKLYPKGALLIFSTAGIYLPFSAEGHIDAGLHPIQHPFTMAHEMSHALGYGDEATCNFLAYLACAQSSDLSIQYSGVFSYWRYLARSMRSLDRKYYAEFYKQMDKGLKNDLIEIYRELDKYPSIMPRIRNLIYDHYLKSQGVREGILSYSRIIPLVKSWNEREN